MTREQELSFSILCSQNGWHKARIQEARDEIRNLIEQQAKDIGVLRAAMPDLNPVISWLKNGCATEDAIAELEIHRARITKALTGQ